MSRRRRRTVGPHALTPAKRTAFMTALKAGNRTIVASRYAGLNPLTVNEWLRRGQGVDDRPSTPFYVRFYEEAEESRAHAEAYAVAQVRQNMPRDANAARWWLENTSEDWRHRNDVPPPPTSTSVQVTTPTQIIVVDREFLEEMGIERVRALREPKQVTDGGRTNGVDRRARLVEDSATTVDI